MQRKKSKQVPKGVLLHAETGETREPRIVSILSRKDSLTALKIELFGILNISLLKSDIGKAESRKFKITQDYVTVCDRIIML